MMNLVKSTKLVAFLASLSLTTTSLGCLDQGRAPSDNVKLVATEVVAPGEPTADPGVCEDCTEGADEAAAALAEEVQAWLDDLDVDVVEPAVDDPYGELAIDPIKICKSIADVKKAVEALNKARKAYKAWKAAAGLGKCAKAAIALAEIATAISLVGGAIAYFTKKGDCMSDAEKQMLEDLKKGLDELNRRQAEQELKNSAKQCEAPAPGGTGGGVSK